jgi:6-pyruvoyl-tetrahydropterin synthase
MIRKGGGRMMKDYFVRKQVVETLLEEMLAAVDDVEQIMSEVYDKNRHMFILEIEKELIDLEGKIHGLTEKIETIQFRSTQPVQPNVSFELSL